MPDAAAGPALMCSRCDAEITAESLAQGLAVRIDGQLVCPLCVDDLPAQALVQINRIRALRGLQVTTYRVAVPAHPRLMAYTFTTALQLALHRRQLVATGVFEAPLLEPGRALPDTPAPPPPARRPGAAMRWLVAGGAAAAVAAVLAVALAGGRGPAPKPDPAPAPAPAPAPSPPTAAARSDPAPASPAPVLVPAAPAQPTRSTYAPDAVAALHQALADPTCPASLRASLIEEARGMLAGELRQREARLGGADRATAAALERQLAALDLPDLPELAQLAAWRVQLVQRAQAIAQAPVPAPARTEPRPPATPDPVSPPAPVVAQPALPPPVTVPPAQPAQPPNVRVEGWFGTGPTFLRTDGSEYIPAPWPSVALGGEGTDRRIDSQRFCDSRRGKGEISFAVEADAVRGGGLLLLVHPGTERRKDIEIQVGGGAVQTLAFAAPAWTAFAVPAPAALPAGAPVAVRLHDRNGPNAPFVLGPVATVAGGVPDPRRHWQVASDHLPRLAEDQLKKRVDAIDAVRRKRGYDSISARPELLAMARVVGGGLPDPAVTLLRARLEDIQGKRCYNGQVDSEGDPWPPAEAWPAWWQTVQLKAASDSKAVVNTAHYGLLVLLSGGAGQARAATATAGLARQLKELDAACRAGEAKSGERGGVLLVVGIGGFDPPGDELPAELVAARQALRKACTAEGVPFVDLAAAGGDTKAARGEAVARLLGDGLACLAHQLRYVGPKKK